MSNLYHGRCGRNSGLSNPLQTGHKTKLVERGSLIQIICRLSLSRLQLVVAFWSFKWVDDPPATNRILNPYLSARETWQCPADRGIFDFRPTCFAAVGNCYRFNGPLFGDYVGIAEDPDYNLGLKKEAWPPDPSRFIMMHEWAAFPWQADNITSWHGASNPGKMFTASTLNRDPDKLISPVLFVDGHGQQCDFTAIIRKNMSRGLEPGKDWMWYKPLK